MALQKIAFKSYCYNWHITQVAWDLSVNMFMKDFNTFFPLI